MLIITPITIFILILLYLKLSWDVITCRRRYKISVGDGGNENLLRAIRSQANLSEYAPLALIALVCLELNRAPVWVTAILALIFIIGRLLHPLGMKSAESSLQPRSRGMMLTFLSLLLMAFANIVFLVLRLF